jgi:hypothetical protein
MQAWRLSAPGFFAPSFAPQTDTAPSMNTDTARAMNICLL